MEKASTRRLAQPVVVVCSGGARVSSWLGWCSGLLGDDGVISALIDAARPPRASVRLTNSTGPIVAGARAPTSGEAASGATLAGCQVAVRGHCRLSRTAIASSVTARSRTRCQPAPRSWSVLLTRWLAQPRPRHRALLAPLAAPSNQLLVYRFVARRHGFCREPPYRALAYLAPIKV